MRAAAVVRLIVVAASCVGIAACSSSPSPSGSTGGCNTTIGSGTVTANVNIVTDPNTVGAFTPKTVSVKAGEAVKWTWQDPSVSHTVTADDSSFDSGLCAPNSTFTVTFATAGTFTYKCTVHPLMMGTVTVT